MKQIILCLLCNYLLIISFFFFSFIPTEAASSTSSIEILGPVEDITVNTSDYFPLESGLSWSYLQDGSISVTRTILPDNEEINGLTTKVFQVSGGEFSGSSLNYSNNENGIRKHKEYRPGVILQSLGTRDVTFVFSPPVTYANANATIGETVNGSGTVDYTISGFGTFELDYNSTSQLVQFENITVPSGNFDTIKIQSSVTSSGIYTTTTTSTIWIAKYVGVVKESVAVDGPQRTIELVSINFQPYPYDFTVNQTTGVSPLTLNFTDISDGNISSWLWNFGDNSTSTLQNPAHTYSNSGNYSVSLTVTGLGNSATETKTDYIKIALPGADINNDQKVDLSDAILVLQILTNAEPQPILSQIADINGDAKTGLEEAAYILQFISGINR